MADSTIIGSAIARLRRALHLTQQALAELLYVSHQAVSKWEHGIALPDVITCYSISRLFGVTMEQLVTGDVDQRLRELQFAAM